MLTVMTTDFAGPLNGEMASPRNLDAMQLPVGVPAKRDDWTVATVLLPLGAKVTDTRALPPEPSSGLHEAEADEAALAIAALASPTLNSICGVAAGATAASGAGSACPIVPGLLAASGFAARGARGWRFSTRAASARA
jgi:hypothetical protein